MNINDYPSPDTYPESWKSALHQIYDLQAQLMKGYLAIEGLPHWPVSIHHPDGQRILKEFARRVDVELGESYEALVKHDDRTVAKAHQWEELVDAVHFYMDFMLYSGLPITILDELTDQFEYTLWNPYSALIFEENAMRRVWPTQGSPIQSFYCHAFVWLNVAVNFLRNKPWKQSHVPTDEKRFTSAVILAWGCFLELLRKAGMTHRDFFDIYWRKYQVNRFRQESKY